ncbi:MAG: sulfite exporter TauE/SafE family protein [Flavobacterium sp.]|nr:sulfite exporter TauE/SafE family protein [Flavobacterium sp.]
MIDSLYLFIALALLAEILGTLGGFGSSLFFIPLATYFLDFDSALGITALFHVFSNLSKIALFRKGIDKTLLLHMGLPAILFVVFGAYLSAFINGQILELVMALFLIVLATLFLVKKTIRISPSTTNAILGGASSGFISGILGTGGAIRGLTLATYQLPIAVFIATSALIDLGIDCSRTVIYYYNGYIHTKDLYLLPILFLVSVLGTYIGKKILERVAEQHFRVLVLGMILLTGLSTLVKLLLP